MARKISGKRRYFGKDKAEGLKRFASERDLILATGEVPDRKEKITVRDLVNEFLTAKTQEVEEGNIGKRHFDALYTVCARVVTQFGATARISELGPSDFLKLRTRLARGRSLPTLSREIRCVRSLFKFADEMDLLETGLTNAVDLVMGHAVSENDMSARYRHHVSDDHLKQVAMHVRAWVFPPGEDSPR